MPDSSPAPSWAAGKRVLLGVSGGIAAYKSPDIVRAFIKAGAEVDVILTDAAAKLVSPLALSTVSRRRAWRDEDLLSEERGWQIPHISLTASADVFVIAPATANVIGQAASGLSQSLLGAAMLAYGGRKDSSPMVFFPAMNENMLDSPAVRENIETLRRRGHIVADPDVGELACGVVGRGRLPSPDVITELAWHALSRRDLVGLKILVTAGPTHEHIDPVRFISNPSTGKMGYAIARAAAMRGADVVLVSGPCAIDPPVGVRVRRVVSAAEMLDACLEEAGGADIVVKAAAVGDYRAARPRDTKMKRTDAATIAIELEQNADIVREISARRKPGQVIIGFAAETDDVVQNAERKIASKGLDAIAANDVTEPGSGFASDTNRLIVIEAPSHGGARSEISGSKLDAADALLDIALKIRCS